MLRWCGKISRKDKNDLAKKCVNYEVNGVRLIGKIWREVMEKDCLTKQLIKEDSEDHSRWSNLIKDIERDNTHKIGSIFSCTRSPRMFWIKDL